MFPHSSERTIEPTPPVKRRAIQRIAPAVGLFLLFAFFTSAAAQDVAFFERGLFSKIEFSEDCRKHQWMLTLDNALQLQMAPPRSGVCTAALHFYSPQDASTLDSLDLEVRSTEPGPFLRVGVQETPEAEAVFSRSFPRFGTDWMEGRARLSQIRDGWRPHQIAVLYLVVVSNRQVDLGPSDRVEIRNIRFTPRSAAVAMETPRVDVTPSVPKRAAVAPRRGVSSEASARPKASQPSMGSTLFVIARWLLLGIIGFAALWWGGKHRRRRILSPLYEINMRTWKTQRDAHEVVQWGGFKKLTLADLKGIKQAGFNALWLMGIWEVGAKVRDLSKTYAPDFQGSPFAIFDYAISSDLGTEQEFRDVVQRAHNQRLSVIVDFVPNHMGLDSAWLNDHPEYFIHRVLDDCEADLPDDDLKQKYPGYFPYRTPSYPQGDRRVPKTVMVAYGKDPYFYPWIDTAQLDHANPGLRQRLIDLLCYWARTVDGVRCDMAMLLIRDQIKTHRHPEMSWDSFNQLMPGEFWTEAIQAVKKVNPHFIFLAETYWSMEGTLQNLGFDYTYNKPLYEAICSAVHSGHAEGLMNFLRLLGTDFLQRSVHFLENHDEERAMNSLGEERQRAAAAILCTLPGIALLHQGQMEGKRERLPVQRVIPLHQEPDHQALRHFYSRLLQATDRPVFQEGRLTALYSNNSALVSYARLDNDSKVLVIVNASSKKQRGSVFLMPGLRLHSSVTYKLQDLFYEFKTNTAGTVQPFYLCPASKLINQGLYVELEPFDAHIFLVESQGALQTTQKALKAVRQVMDEWPLNRVARRVLGAAFTRSSDANLAANPTGRQS